MAFGSRIIGTGSSFPAKEVHNRDLETFLDTSDEWIKSRTGIETRRIADPKRGENTLSLSLGAAKKALDSAKLDPAELDAVIVATITPQSVMPTTANYLQGKLKAKKAFSFDLQAACAGFVYGLSIADQFIRNGYLKNALIIGADTLSTIMNWRDRSTCVLFGDAAGAVILSQTSTEHQILGTKLYSDGTKSDILNIKHGFCEVPPYSAEYRHENRTIYMDGKEVFKQAVKGMTSASLQILEECHFNKDDVDFFIFHQANLRIIDRCVDSLELDRKKVWINLQKYGNTSSATLPVSLDEAIRSGTVKSGQLILMTSFGGGLAWGTVLLRL